MTTEYSDVAKAAAALAGDPKAEQEVRAEIAKNALVSALLAQRVSRGLTQEKVAESMGCDPSKVSRLESGNDENLRWVDIEGYLRAVNVRISILFDDPSLPAADKIKHHVFRIDYHLESLIALAKEGGGNDMLAQKIHQFYAEVLFNFLKRYKDSYDKLSSVIKIPPQMPERVKPAITEQAGEDTAKLRHPAGC
jgi:transcriptional regulator with XRE-family HTH domain